MRVMVVGASSNRAKYGNKAVRAYLRRGHEVLPVNPFEPEVEGISTWGDVADVPGPVDRVTMYVPPQVGEQIVPRLAARTDIGELWFNPGSETPALLDEARGYGLKVVYGCAILDIGEYPD